MKTPTTPPAYPLRRWLLLVCFLAAALLLGGRAVYLQLLNNDFLKAEGDARSVRVVAIPAHRGVITDRNGEQLAMSTPLESISVSPGQISREAARLPELAAALSMAPDALRRFLYQHKGRNAVYLRRQVHPDLAAAVKRLGIRGVRTEPEYKRYYPAADISAHILGFTGIDDQGQEGLELAYDRWLSGQPGKKRVLVDRYRRVVRDIEGIEPARPGKALALSIDRRVQYLAYRELAAATRGRRAKGGWLVMLDVLTGEVMALAGWPAYNPNDRASLNSAHYRNRALTDAFEPGSTMKPFAVAAALESGRYHPETEIDTAPGYFKVGADTVRDDRNFGRIKVADVLPKSSNVGASRLVLSLEPERYWDLLSRFGFGQSSASGFPGEVAGELRPFSAWSRIEMATMSFGYGLTVTPLQLARAYAALAADGILRPVSFVRAEQPVLGQRVIDVDVARQIRAMLGKVVSEGSGRRAAIPGYRVMGKTGTARKAIPGGYAEDRYLSLFAGIAPAGAPRFALLVLIDEPRAGDTAGGKVAAPVFAKVMAGALRLLNIPPDDPAALGRPLLAHIPAAAPEGAGR